MHSPLTLVETVSRGAARALGRGLALALAIGVSSTFGAWRSDASELDQSVRMSLTLTERIQSTLSADRAMRACAGTPSIVNGREVPEPGAADSPSGLSARDLRLFGLAKKVSVRSPGPAGSGLERKEDCTGYIVGPGTLLTAQHCVISPSTHQIVGANRMTIELDAKTSVQARKLIPHPDFDRAHSEAPPESGLYADMVVVLFEEPKKWTPPAEADYPPITRRSIETPARVQFVGFGSDREADAAPHGAGVRRYGTSLARSTDGGWIEVRGDAVGSGTMNSQTSGGDSGGPLIRDGVLHGLSGSHFTRNGVAISAFADLAALENQTFLQQAAAQGARFKFVPDGVPHEGAAPGAASASSE